MNKKKIVIAILFLIFIVSLIIKHDEIYKFYKMNQIKNSFVNTLNGKFDKNTVDSSEKRYIRIHTPIEDLNHYNITELIEKYIEMAEESIKNYKELDDKEIIWGTENIKKRSGLEYGKDIWMRHQRQLFIQEVFTDEDIMNFNNGTFKSKLIEKLKNILDYKEKDGKIEWQINSTKDLLIELPYDCYMNYKAYHREDNKEFKKALDIVFDKDFKLKSTLEKVNVKYETFDDEIKFKRVFLFYNTVDGKEYYTIDMLEILTLGPDTLAEVVLNSHTIDRKKEEWDIIQTEMWLSEWDG